VFERATNAVVVFLWLVYKNRRMDENIVDKIRVERLQKIHGSLFLAKWINRLVMKLGNFLYERGYLSEIVEIDALTGLFNRNFLIDGER